MLRSPLSRRVTIVLAGLLLTALAEAQPPLLPVPTNRAQREQNAAATRAQMRTPVEFRGFDDPDTKLGEAADYLARAYGIGFFFNEKAFRDDAVEDVITTPLGKEIPKMKNVALATVLGRVLDRLDVAGGATWFVRNGVVEVTTVRAYRAEFYPGRPDGPFPPLVSVAFEKLPLEEALKLVAEENDGNVVLDVRAGEKAKSPVTARFGNVPLDTAVLLLADMAGLKSVEVDGVYYVTSRENAKTLREEQPKSRAVRPEAPKAAKDKPAPAEPERPPQDPKEREEQLRRLKATVEGKQPPK